MNDMTNKPADYDATDISWMTCWEVAMWLGIDPMNVLGQWEDGTLPAPRILSPLRWHEDDLIASMNGK